MVTESPAPRRSARVEARKQRTRAAILTAASDLFTRQGYDATTMQELAALADVGLGTLYGYFPSKEDVLRTILDERRQQATASIGELVAAAPSAVERACVLLEAIWQHLHETRPLALALFAIEAAKPHDERHGFDGTYRALVEIIRRGQGRGEVAAVPAENTARALLSVYTWSALRLGLWRGVGETDTVLRDLSAITRRILSK